MIVIEAPEDADVVIVQTEIETAMTCKTVVVADDTDILVLFLCHTTSDCSHIYFSPECKQGLSNTAWTIREMQQHLGQEVFSLLPFCHALLGCDTTGHVYQQKQIIEKMVDFDTFRQLCHIFSNCLATKQQIVDAGEPALVMLYDGSSDTNLDQLRQHTFASEFATSSTFFHLQELPPTRAAASYHTMRVYLQSKLWLYNNNLSPENSGWQQLETVFSPIMTDAKPAPPHILKVIKCA